MIRSLHGFNYDYSCSDPVSFKWINLHFHQYSMAISTKKEHKIMRSFWSIIR